MAHPTSAVSELPAVAARAIDTPAAPWHTLAVGDALLRQRSSVSGLASDEAATRLQQHGPNELEAVRRDSAWHTLAAQFQNALIVILLCATVISGFLGHALEAAVICIIVLFAVLLGFLQEYRASRALDALRQMASPNAHVVRDGHEVTIPAREVVPGDVLVLRAGDRVAADCRVVQSVSLAIEEAALTGESEPVQKITDALGDPRLALGDRRNMAYAGTLITQGRGQGLAVATGMSTEFGHIARMVETVVVARTPLQDNLDRLGGTLGKAALAVVALVVAIGLFRGQPVVEMFMFGIALAVAVVPEALPAVVTISLAIGVRRMVKRHALVRRLPIVETLGSTSVICSDKTGTLTKNEMTVRQLFVDGAIVDVTGAGYDTSGEFVADGHTVTPSANVRALLAAALLSSDARLVTVDGRPAIEGDPTEGALVVAAVKAGLHSDELNRREPRINEIPFTSERRRMTTLHETGAGTVAYSKGAAEEIVASCASQRIGDRAVPLDDETRDRVLAVERQMASSGLRVLAVAVKTPVTPDTAEHGMTLLGLIAMMDPPRREALDAVRTCRAAGIRAVMITGDHPLTAMAVARELQLASDRPAVTGRELEHKSDADLDREVTDIAVYARVSPADKLRIVRAWQKRGAVCAMTGDGVNDAPALKQADIGIAMGITGTDVSKEAAGMTLLDDNFATIVAAVEEGRIVFGNIKKYLMYLLSCNVGEIVLLAGSVIAGLPMPLTAVQILYVNLATDGLPALALSVDPPERDIMQQPPRDRRAGIFTAPVTAMLLTAGLWSAAVNIYLFTSQLRAGRPVEEAMAMTFVALVLIQFFNAYCCRSDHASVLDRPFANRWLNLAVVWELALLVAIAYIPFFQRAFGTFALTTTDWLLTVGLAFSIVPVLEVVKAMTRRRQ
ncbi:MAG TPA: cation-translocating P-type ATPase [Vicinamibacterales bacterium]|nr:cation-translocating P-type ATPase [Vicinamibacterales bacterium]